MIIPLDRLSPEALTAVVEEYVTRDGTELTDAATKSEQVRAAVQRGELVLVFDRETETCTFLTPDAAAEAAEDAAAQAALADDAGESHVELD